MALNKGVVIAAAVLMLSACSEKEAAEEPGFRIGEVNFSYAIPKGFCSASQDWKRAFEPIAQQNPDKAMLAQLVDCVENAKFANSPNYILVATYSDPARQGLSRADQVRDFKAKMDPQKFAAYLDSNKPFGALQAELKGSPDKLFGEQGNAFPEVSDDVCIYSGGRYGQPPLTPENSGTVINCQASIGDRQIMIMYNGDGKQDLLAMARKVRALARSIQLQD
ncbi:MAG: hypothetical protein KGZ65_06355 [Sphingomonadales bacterium]|nr:hypothetical protein [Sphingomonadaceae bacterium]MBS3930841.1 hypothetical protein [Sphingomonadales bacterium]